MTVERKPIIAVATTEETKLLYSVARHGNCFFRLWINNSAVDTIFDSEKAAFDYAMECANIDKYLYPGTHIETL